MAASLSVRPGLPGPMQSKSREAEGDGPVIDCIRPMRCGYRHGATKRQHYWRSRQGTKLGYFFLLPIFDSASHQPLDILPVLPISAMPRIPTTMVTVVGAVHQR